MRTVVIGLTITSSWGNGHATTYRALLREFARRGHDILFLERDAPWYAANRDLAEPPYCRTVLYSSNEELRRVHSTEIRQADCVIVGSYVPEGVEVGEWVTETAEGITAFYDIDTPVTVASLGRRDCGYLTPELIPKYDLYLSFTGGPLLRRLEKEFGARSAVPLHCSVDPELYFPDRKEEEKWDLGYLGTYAPDRQPTLERLLCAPASAWKGGRFVVAGPQYPRDVAWPENVYRIDHLPPGEHRSFYNSQRFTLNVTRADMVAAGWSPSVRLFEAAACGTPIISDSWAGLDAFFKPGEEILVAGSAREALSYLGDLRESERREIGRRGMDRVFAAHTAAHRAAELERYIMTAAT